MLENQSILDPLPTWAFFPLTVLFSAAIAEAGFWLGKIQHRRGRAAPDSSVAAIVGATLALLAFMLGFTFSIAMNRFDQRLAYVVDEANAVGTAYLRADILEEPHRTAVRDLLRDYTHLRVEVAQDYRRFDEAASQSKALQAKLWCEAAAVGKEHPNWPVYSLCISAINEVIDMQTRRLAMVLYARVPTDVWATLFAVGALAIGATGYFCGMSGNRQVVVAAAMVLSVATVVALLVDLDRPWGGTLRTPQQPFAELYASMDQAHVRQAYFERRENQSSTSKRHE